MAYKAFFNNKKITFESGDIFNNNGVIFIHNAKKIGKWGHNNIPNKIKLGEITIGKEMKAQIVETAAFAQPTKNKKNKIRNKTKKICRIQLRH